MPQLLSFNTLIIFKDTRLFRGSFKKREKLGIIFCSADERKCGEGGAVKKPGPDA